MIFTQTQKVREKKAGAIMVVGAGVSGIQAALDAAAAGFKVYLVDKNPSIGGRMAQLDKTFPTNDCSMCILSPKFIECANNPNISILTNATVERVDGEPGNFEVQIIREPRFVDIEKCTGCGACSEYCPVFVPDRFNEGLGSKKCIHIPFPQAMPAKSVIERNRCLFLSKRECQICFPVCKNKAIDFHQQPESITLNVGSIILALGYEPFDPKIQSQYRYGLFLNVLTSLEFERLLSASGPSGGELLRPSDGKVPEKIAWIQCVGSRDKTSGLRYCSSVCCMYATKQVILFKEHHPDSEAVVFHNDIRAYGKGFERYYEKAKSLPKVRYVWSKVSLLEQRDDGSVLIRYRLNGTDVVDESFDLVVLSIGLSPNPEAKTLAEKLGIRITEHGFCESPGFVPMRTSKEGIFSCGCFFAPMDIPDSVTMASGAASLASQFLKEERGSLVHRRAYPEEVNVAAEPPRVGVVICDCGTNIKRVVDVPELVEYAGKLKGVVHAVEEPFACAVDSIGRLINTVKEKGITRVVVAACTPRTHEPVFQDALRQAGLNPFLLEFANIREQCSLVHMNEKDKATAKAKDLIRMAIAKSKMLLPLEQTTYKIRKEALVIGGGISGMVCSLALARQGIKVHLIEKEKELGGTAVKINRILKGRNVRDFLNNLIREVYENLLVQVYTEAQLVGFSGYVGNFSSMIRTRNGRIKEVRHGVTVLATGARELKPEEYFYGKTDRVMTLLELEDLLDVNEDRFKQVKSFVFIQCVGSRCKERPYCSRVCCTQSVVNAIRLKKINPDMDVYILYRDMRTYGFREDYYQEASDIGIVFIRYEKERKPDVQFSRENEEFPFQVAVMEPILSRMLLIRCDMICLASAIVPQAENELLSKMLKVPLNEDGFFMEAHMKLRPVDFATDGIFMCGMAHGPKFIEESIAQAEAAAARAFTILTQDEIKAGGPYATVNASRCSGCGLCEKVCPYGAIEVNPDRKVAEVKITVCKGCGTCISSCRSGAVNMACFGEEHVLEMVRSLSSEKG